MTPLKINIFERFKKQMNHALNIVFLVLEPFECIDFQESYMHFFGDRCADIFVTPCTVSLNSY